MGRQHAADAVTEHSRIGRAVLVAAGVGTVMAAGAGLASAAEAPGSLALAPTGPSTALPQAGALPANLSLADGATQAHGSPLDLGSVNGADLAALGATNGSLSSLGSGFDGADTAKGTDATKDADATKGTDATKDTDATKKADATKGTDATKKADTTKGTDATQGDNADSTDSATN